MSPSMSRDTVLPLEVLYRIENRFGEDLWKDLLIACCHTASFPKKEIDLSFMEKINPELFHALEDLKGYRAARLSEACLLEHTKSAGTIATEPDITPGQNAQASASSARPMRL